MSVLLIVIAFFVFAAVVAGVVMLFAFSRSADGASASAARDGVRHDGSTLPRALGGRRTLALRLEGEDDESFARALCERHAGRCEASVGDVAVDLMRLTPSATHFYLGPSVSGFRSDLPGGVILSFDFEGVGGGGVAAGKGLRGILSVLRSLGPVRYAHLALVTSDAAGTPLAAVDDDARPGHRRCVHCRHAFIVSELTCPNCGAPVRAG